MGIQFLYTGNFYNLGLESGIALFFIALSIYMLYRLEKNKSKMSLGWRQVAWLSVIATLTMFSRLDLVFFAIIVGIWIIFRDEPMRYLVPLDILAIVTAITACICDPIGPAKVLRTFQCGAHYDLHWIDRKAPDLFLYEFISTTCDLETAGNAEKYFSRHNHQFRRSRNSDFGRLQVEHPAIHSTHHPAHRCRTDIDRPDSDPSHGFWITQNLSQV